MKISEKIGQSTLFDGLPAEHLEVLAQICLDQKVEKGRTLFSEGGRAKGFYQVVSGKIKIYKLSREGKEQILHIFGAGEIFGEVPVFAGGSYPANAEGIEPSRVLFFPRDSFIALIEREPSIALNMLAILSQRLRRFTHLIEDLSLKEVPGRLAAHLIYLGERSRNPETLELEITKAQLASLLGTIPETLSRILTKMAQQEIIAVEGKKIVILDRAALESLAAGGKGIV
ncbi:MAG: Crp/Fnr family transcriptional regulator [Syntrophobacteraceae bacterium]